MKSSSKINGLTIGFHPEGIAWKFQTTTKKISAHGIKEPSIIISDINKLNQ